MLPTCPQRGPGRCNIPLNDKAISKSLTTYACGCAHRGIQVQLTFAIWLSLSSCPHVGPRRSSGYGEYDPAAPSKEVVKPPTGDDHYHQFQ